MVANAIDEWKGSFGPDLDGIIKFIGSHYDVNKNFEGYTERALQRGLKYKLFRRSEGRFLLTKEGKKKVRKPDTLPKKRGRPRKTEKKQSKEDKIDTSENESKDEGIEPEKVPPKKRGRPKSDEKTISKKKRKISPTN